MLKIKSKFEIFLIA